MMDAQVSFLDQLFAKGVLHDSGVDGLYARSGEFEDVIARFEKFALTYGQDEISEAMVFPPGMTMQDFETSGYMKNFPQLAGTVHAFAATTMTTWGCCNAWRLATTGPRIRNRPRWH